MNILEIKVALNSVIALAKSQIEDIETGVADGTYRREDNTDLPALQHHLEVVEQYRKTLDEGAESLALLVGAAREELASRLPLSAEEALDLGNLKVKLESQIRLAQGSNEIVKAMLDRYGYAVAEDEPINGGDAVEDLVGWIVSAQELFAAGLPENSVSVHQGWLQIGTERIDVTFEVPAGATQAEKDAAMFQQIAQEAEVDYVSIS